jgi:hypothetical protein
VEQKWAQLKGGESSRRELEERLAESEARNRCLEADAEQLAKIFPFGRYK